MPTVVLHVGDFDPSGVVMFQAAGEDVSAFVEEEGGSAEFERVALTRSQVARYNLPGAPPKSSSHDAAWRAGEDAVQLEAMAPNDLAAEVRLAVESWLDLDLLAEAKSGEDGNARSSTR